MGNLSPFPLLKSYRAEWCHISGNGVSNWGQILSFRYFAFAAPDKIPFQPII